MAKFVYLYKGGGMPETEEEGRRLMEAWTTWFDSLGGAVLDIGNPFGASKATNGNGTSGITGYSIVEAADIAQAVEMSKGCPIFEGGRGDVETYEALAM
jgi:hypothetical protein